MSELRVGDRIKDNDPRMYSGNRWLIVNGIHGDHVTAAQFGNGLWTVRIQRKRIFTDSKPRRTGFSRVEAAK